MKQPPMPPDEALRCDTLHQLNILDTPREERFDRITRLAQTLFDVPVVLVSLVDADRQWFKSRQGLDATETPRWMSFCGHTIAQLSDDTFVIEDALQDERFADNPLVVGDPKIRFYAGQPLNGPGGHRMGTLCLIDRKPRRFTGEDRRNLKDLATLVEAELRKTPPVPGKPMDPSERRRRQRAPALDVLWSKAASRFSTVPRAAGLSVFCAILVLMGGWLWDQQQLKTYQLGARQSALQNLTDVQGQLESTLNSKLHLVHSLSGYVIAHGRIEAAAFTRFASEVAYGVAGVRSLQLAPDGVIQVVWPLEGNQEAVGHDLLADPDRRKAAVKAIETNSLWIAGPLKLIQGGEALIGRLPIFTRRQGQAGHGSFWGFGTILIDLKPLLEEVGLQVTDGNYRYALRGRNAMGSQGEVFFGDPALFETSALLGEIKLPAGSWQIAALPVGGWPSHWPGQTSFRFGVTMLSLLIGSLVYFLMRLPLSLQRAVGKATYALERSEAKFRDAIEALPEGFVIFDPSDNLAVCNERFREIYATCRPRLQPGRGYMEIQRYGVERGMLAAVDPNNRAAIDAYLMQAATRHREKQQTYEEKLANGMTLKVIERRMRDGGSVSFHMDISVQKANEAALVEARERAEQGNRAKSAFLATVSHEVRTPLNGVLGLLSVLQEDTALSKQQLEYVKTAHQSAKHLLAILNEILDLSKLEADRFELDLQPFGLLTTIQEAVDLIRAQAQAKQLPIKTCFEADLDCIVIGDAGRLRQVLLNLLSNAIKFTETGGVEIRACADRTAPERVILRVEVEDTGIGFDEADASKLFQPFSQLDNSADRRHMGTGLGLVICRRLVRLMGGEIKAKGHINKGATFSIEIPMSLADSSALSARTSVAKAPLPKELGGPPVRVLLAEDSQTNQLVIQAMLNDTGYRIDVAHNGKEALDALSRLRYDVVLMDIYMPEMDGLTATRQIRTKDELRDVPIIALTANAMQGDELRFLEAGMDDYLPKPITRDELLTKLYQWSGPDAKRQTP